VSAAKSCLDCLGVSGCTSATTARVHRPRVRRPGVPARRQAAVHPARRVGRERLRRVAQRPAPRRGPVRHPRPRPGRRPGTDRGVAPRPQRRAPAQRPRRPHPCGVRAGPRPPQRPTRLVIPAPRPGGTRGQHRRGRRIGAPPDDGVPPMRSARPRPERGREPHGTAHAAFARRRGHGRPAVGSPPLATLGAAADVTTPVGPSAVHAPTPRTTPTAGGGRRRGTGTMRSAGRPGRRVRRDASLARCRVWW
jgi:hypothetical protein